MPFCFRVCYRSVSVLFPNCNLLYFTFPRLSNTLTEFCADEQRRLYAALDTLDEKRRVTVVLYYFDDRSVKEIAQATGVTEGTVKSRLFSARRHLRQALTDRESRPKEVASHE